MLVTPRGNPGPLPFVVRRTAAWVILVAACLPAIRYAPTTMCLTAEQFEAQRLGQFTGDFARLSPELTRAQRGQPAQDVVARRSIGMMLPEQLAPVHTCRHEMRRRRRLVARDLTLHGQRAVDWYGAAPGGGTRRLDGGTPRARAVARASSCGGDSGDDSSGEPGPGLGSGHLDLDAWLADRRRVLTALIGGEA